MNPGIPPRVLNIMPPIIDLVKERATYWRERGEAVINLGQAVPGFPPPQVALEAAQAALLKSETHIYSADAGLPALRQALAYRLEASFQARVNPETEIIITTGGNQAFLLALLTFLEPGDEVILPSPFFMNHEMAVRALGGVPVEAALSEEDGFSISWKVIEPFLTLHTRAIVIVSPSNPTGAVISPQALAEIAAQALARDLYLIGDEAYMHFVYDGAQHVCLASLPDWRRGVLVTGTFSKTFAMTGWRVGYLIGPEKFIEQALKLQDTMVICAPVIAQEAMLVALNEAWEHAHHYNVELNARRMYLSERLARIPELSWQPTRGGFFAFTRIAGCKDSLVLCMDLIDKERVVTLPGSIFGRAGEGFLRLSYGVADQTQLEEACTRIESYLKMR